MNRRKFLSRTALLAVVLPVVSRLPDTASRAVQRLETITARNGAVWKLVEYDIPDAWGNAGKVWVRVR